jgi:hypothetical protein
MAEKEEVIAEKLDYTGLFSFSNLYSFMYNWLTQEEGYDVNEDKYSEKVSGDTRSLLIEWKASKKMADYYRIEMKIKFEIDGMKDVEVEVEGKKTKMNKGKVAIGIKGLMVIDPDSNWEVTPFYQFLRDVYNKYIIPKRIVSMEARTFAIVTNLREDIKEFLDASGRI